MKKWKIGIVSATGFARKRHMPPYTEMLQDRLQIAACCDMDEAALKQTCDELGIPGRYTNVDDMLKDPSLEIIVVVNRPEWHIPTARKCILAGKHVLVEKPLSESYQEIVDFLAFLKGRKEQVMVSQNYRFQGAAMGMREVIQSGELGQVYWVELVKYVSAGAKPADHPKYKGPFVNIGIHDLDQIRSLLPGREVRTIYAPPLKPPHAQVKYPFTEVHMTFDDGAYAMARMDWSTQGLESWTCMRAQGTKAVGMCDYPKGIDIMVHVQGQPVRAIHRDAIDQDIFQVMSHFLDCLESGRCPETCVEDNIKTMELMIGAYLSCRDNRVVHLPQDRPALMEI